MVAVWVHVHGVVTHTHTSPCKILAHVLYLDLCGLGSKHLVHVENLPRSLCQHPHHSVVIPVRLDHHVGLGTLPILRYEWSDTAEDPYVSLEVDQLVVQLLPELHLPPVLGDQLAIRGCYPRDLVAYLKGRGGGGRGSVHRQVLTRL